MDETESCVQSLGLQEPKKAHVFLPGTCVYHWRKDKRETKRIFHVHYSSSLHRNQERQRERRIHKSTSIDVRCSKTRSVRVAHVAQLNSLLGGKKPMKNCISHTQCHGQLEESCKSCRGTSTWTSQPIFQKVKKIRGRTHFGMCSVQTDILDEPVPQQHQTKRLLTKTKQQTACLQVPAWRHLRTRSQTGAQVTQYEEEEEDWQEGDRTAQQLEEEQHLEDIIERRRMEGSFSELNLSWW